VGEDVPQENFAASEVNLSDDPVLVASDIEHRVLAYLIGGLKGLVEISKHSPISFSCAPTINLRLAETVRQG
jgi:hypothetical protein